MIGDSGGNVDISEYLVNFNSADWANKANQYLTSALEQGIGESKKYTQQAIDTSQKYGQQADQRMEQGFQRAQALDAPKQLASYQALDRYQDMLGLARPADGSFQTAKALENRAMKQPQYVQQEQLANAYNQGLLGPVQQQPANPSLFGGNQ